MKYQECNECKCRNCVRSLCAKGQCNTCNRLHRESNPPVNYNVTLVCRQHLGLDEAMTKGGSADCGR